MHLVQRLDVFPKYDTAFEAEARDRTVVGAGLSLGSMVLIVILSIYEAQYYNQVIVRHQLDVDTSGDGHAMPVFLNISFPSLVCSRVGLDAVDAVGDPVREGSTVDMVPLEGGVGCNLGRCLNSRFRPAQAGPARLRPFLLFSDEKGVRKEVYY